MKDRSQSTDDKLLRYLDGAMSNTEKQAFEEELKINIALRNELEHLQDIGVTMRTKMPEQPSKNFTQLVMSRLDQYPLAAQKNFSIRNGILLLTGVLVAIGLATLLVSAGVFDNAMTTIDLNQMKLPQGFLYYKSLPSIPFNGKLVVNMIIVLNLGLAWLVLDRAILKPLFQRRMQEGH